MENNIEKNIEEAVIACCENAKDGNDPAQNMKAALDGYEKLKQGRDEEKLEKKEGKKTLITFITGVLTVLIPSIVVELLQESFMDKQANKAYEFERTGTVSTTPGKVFVGNLFKQKRK